MYKINFQFCDVGCQLWLCSRYQHFVLSVHVHGFTLQIAQFTLLIVFKLILTVFQYFPYAHKVRTGTGVIYNM